MPTSRRAFLAGSLAAPAAFPAPSSPGVAHAVLGRTGLKCSRLVFGSTAAQDPGVFARAIDLGINFFDTSRDYQHGNNERALGLGLKGRRDRVVLSSKSIDIDLPGQAAGPRETVSEALAQIETSLRELQTDHLDIWYLHHKDRPEQITDNLLEAAEIARKQGKIRFAGVSTHRIAATLDRILASPGIDVVMATYSFLSGPEVAAAIARLHASGRGVVAFKSTAGGRRGNNPAMKRDGGMVAAYRWALRDPNVHVVEADMVTYEHVEENVACMRPFTDEDARLLAARTERIGGIQCRMCGRCEGSCRMGLPVEEIQRYLMYVEGYGQFASAREKYLRIPAEVRGQACRKCEGCTVRCRFGVQVAGQVRRAQEVFA